MERMCAYISGGLHSSLKKIISLKRETGYRGFRWHRFGGKKGAMGMKANK